MKKDPNENTFITLFSFSFPSDRPEFVASPTAAAQRLSTIGAQSTDSDRDPFPYRHHNGQLTDHASPSSNHSDTSSTPKHPAATRNHHRYLQQCSANQHVGQPLEKVVDRRTVSAQEKEWRRSQRIEQLGRRSQSWIR